MKCLIAPAVLASALGAQTAEFFETRVRPMLARHCYACHGAEKQFSGLRVDSREALLAGGKRGPALVAGRPGESRMVQALRGEGLQMPLGGRLAEGEIAAIEQWIRNGAEWPASPSGGAAQDHYQKLLGEHWAFQPVRKPAALAGINALWRARLARAGLRPAPEANRRVLARRLGYVLTGLPVAPEEIGRFAADASAGAYERLVDRLLASPRFGEHWARHWMDVVRYGETRGYEWNYEIAGAWRYRDYLIRAFNADVPYDQLVREHIAGDLLASPRVRGDDAMNESVTGTAFYRLGEAGHDDCVRFREIALDVVDNQIDTLTKAFQGLTVACARCHDHKLDPIPTEDYYSLYGILNSSRPVVHSIDLTGRIEGTLARLREIKDRMRRETGAAWLAASTVLPTGKPDDPPESPSFPLAALRGKQGAEFATAWRELGQGYRTEHEQRVRFNRTHFEPFADWTAWQKSGAGVADGWRLPGEWSVAEQGESVVAGIYPAGLYTHSLSSRLNGALRSPWLPKHRKHLSVRVMGGLLGARRVIVDNCAIGEGYKVIEAPSPVWVRLDTHAREERLPAFFEMVTRWDNPRIPDRPGVLKGDQLKWIDGPRSYWGIAGAVLHDVEETPREELGHVAALFEQPVASWEELQQSYRLRMSEAIRKWTDGAASDDDVRWLEWMLRAGVVPNRADMAAGLRENLRAYREAEARIDPPRVVEGLADAGPGRDYPVLRSGDPKSPGAPASRRFLARLFGERPFTSGSGRLELAEILASPSNPLTARVMVNRVWHHVFGRGIVASVDNFGAMGDTPSNLELLDHLASRFVEEGWSLKKLIRAVVTSQAFRQSGETTPRAREADPENRLLHHYPLRRLTAEELRDSILASSGRLDETMYGPSIEPWREQPKDYRRLFSGPLDGGGRRSVYTKITRMEGPAFLEIFDYPVPMAARGARDVTNVPAQALALLNDPFVTGQAEAWGALLAGDGSRSVEERLDHVFRTALGRPPAGDETERFRGLAAGIASLRGAPPAGLMAEGAVWKDVAHAVFNLKEFLFYH